MRWRVGLVGAVGAMSLACAGLSPVAPPSADYVGVWESDGSTADVTLEIDAAGNVDWDYEKGGMTTNLNGPATGCDDEMIRCCLGMGKLSVDEVPHEEDGSWHMTINGHDLVRR